MCVFCVNSCLHVCVRMHVRASTHASSCMCAVARMCSWFSACCSVLVLACMLTSISVFASVFVYVFSVRALCPGLRVRLCRKLASIISRLCPRGHVEGGGLSENLRARGARAKILVYIYIYMYIIGVPFPGSRARNPAPPR